MSKPEKTLLKIISGFSDKNISYRLRGEWCLSMRLFEIKYEVFYLYI